VQATALCILTLVIGQCILTLVIGQLFVVFAGMFFSSIPNQTKERLKSEAVVADTQSQ